MKSRMSLFLLVIVVSVGTLALEWAVKFTGRGGFTESHSPLRILKTMDTAPRDGTIIRLFSPEGGLLGLFFWDKNEKEIPLYGADSGAKPKTIKVSINPHWEKFNALTYWDETKLRWANGGGGE